LFWRLFFDFFTKNQKTDAKTSFYPYDTALFGVLIPKTAQKSVGVETPENLEHWVPGDKSPG
jgi:hypothetical protein